MCTEDIIRMRDEANKAYNVQVTEVMSLGHRNVFSTPALVQGAILSAMRDLCKCADDTAWLTPCETVFERLATLYLLAGGLEQRLIDEWPECFSKASSSCDTCPGIATEACQVCR